MEPGSHRVVVVVSHAAVLATNRGVYGELAAAGTRVELVVPSRWRNEYVPGGFVAEAADDLLHVHPTRVVGKGHPQRHAYLARGVRLLSHLDADVVLIEEEPFSLAALQWSRAARRARVPYGVQVAETLDLAQPAPVARSRHSVLSHAAFVVARSPSAAQLARRWGAQVEPDVVPHDVADADERVVPTGEFTVAYVGRLVEEKGLGDLLGAVVSLEGARLVVAGAGPMAGAVAGAGPRVEYLGPLPHGRVGEVYARAHVTCVPSRTTPRWVEQFGRVVVESLVRGVPVVVCATGELPWVLSVTGGGVLAAERDPAALATALATLRDDPAGTQALGRAGRGGVRSAFTTPVVAATLARVLERVTRR